MHGVLKLDLVSGGVKWTSNFVLLSYEISNFGKLFVNFHYTVVMLMIRICILQCEDSA